MIQLNQNADFATVGQHRMNRLKLFWKLLRRTMVVSFISIAVALFIQLKGAYSMTDSEMALDEQQREAIIEALTTELSANFAIGLKSLRNYDEHRSEDLKWDLLAMAWRVALASNDKVVRQRLVNYQLEIVVTGTAFLQGQALKYLQDYLPSDFDQQAIGVLKTLPLTGDYASEVIRLIGIAQVRSMAPVLREIANTKWAAVKSDSFYANRTWAAWLVLARFGDRENTQRVIEQVRGEPSIVLRATRLFADLAYTRQSLAFDALRLYLQSQNRLPQVKDTVPGDLESRYAAELFAKYAIGCPITAPDVYEKDIATIRRWADAQVSWKIRDSLSPA